MKTCLTLCLSVLFLTLPAMAEGEQIAYPQDEPLITFTMPEGWLTHFDKDGTFQAAASQEADTLLIVKPLAATKKDGSAAIAEIKEPLDKTYGDAIEYDKLEEGGTENLGFYILNAKATTHTADEGDVKSFINSVMITFPDSEELLLAQFLATQKGSEENGEAIMSIIQSFKKVE